MVLSAGILVASICNSSSSVYSYPTVCVCVMERQAARSRPTAGEPKRRVKGRGEAGGVVSCRMCGGTYVLYVRMGWEEGIWILEGEPAGDGEGVRRSVGRRELLLVTWRRRGPEDCRFVGTESSAGGAAPPPRLPLRPLARSSQLPFSASASRAWLLQAGAGANLVISSSATVLCPAGQGLPTRTRPHHTIKKHAFDSRQKHTLSTKTTMQGGSSICTFICSLMRSHVVQPRMHPLVTILYV